MYHFQNVKIQSAVFSFIAIFVTLPNVFSQDDPSTLAEYAKSAWLDELSKIHSGHYQIDGISQSPDHSDGRTSTFIIRGQFDYDKNLRRFERFNTDWLTGDGLITVRDGEFLQFVSDGSENALWMPGNHVLGLASDCNDIPGYKHVLNSFDIRVLGMQQASDFDMPIDDFAGTFEAFWSPLGYKLESAERLPSGIRINWSVNGIPDLFRTVFLDKTFNFLPGKMQLFFVENSVERVVWDVNVMWLNREGVHVPSEVQMMTYPSVATDNITIDKLLEFSFTWNDVNTDIDRGVFSETALDTNPGALVMDYSIPKGIFLRRIADPELAAVLSTSENIDGRDHLNDVGRRRLLLTANVVVGLGVVLGFVVRVMRQRRNSR